MGHVIISSLAAFPLAKYKLRIGWVFNVVVSCLMFSSAVLWIPQYVIMSSLNMIDTYLVYILPALPAPIGVFLMKQFMEQIPFVLVESATIDGASQWRIFWRIVMPQVKPAWLTLTLFAFQSVWNQSLQGLVFSEELKMLGDAISQIMAGGFVRMGASMAGSVFMIIPPFLLFLLTQNRVIETMAYSGIKG